MTRRFAPITDRVHGLGGDRWAVHQRGLELAADGREILFLSIGDPDHPTPPSVVETAAESLRSGRTTYSNGRGEAALLESVADHYRTRTGRAIGTEQVIFLPGTQTAVALAMLGLAGAGDEVLVPEPYYATYEAVVAMTGADLVPVPLDPDRGFHLDPERLAEACTDRTVALLLNTPHNPTGATLTADEVAAIGEVCVAHDLWIVSDEVYAALVPDGAFTSPFDDPEIAERTVVVSSLSKSHAMTGWRCGWLVGSAEVTERILPIAESILFGSQPFLQDAATHALRHEMAAAAEMGAIYRRRADVVAEVLAFSDSVSATTPEAGIFMMIDARSLGMSGVDLAFRLLEEESVAVMPGESFGPSAAGHLRISLTNDDAILVEAARRIVRFVGRLAAAD